MIPEEVIIFGTGNVATNLAFALKNARVKIRHIVGSCNAKAKRLADQVGVGHSSFSIENFRNAICFLAVQDDSIGELSKKLAEESIYRVHCSGSMHINAHSLKPENTGVFYPLQTFHSAKVSSFKEVPVLLESENNLLLNALQNISNKLGANASMAKSNQRLKVHIAAVFACNFTNHMFTQAQKLLSDNNLDIHLLDPLIQKTTSQVIENNAAEMQTGPAKRNDAKVVNKHSKMLSGNAKEIYDLLSRSIDNFK